MSTTAAPLLSPEFLARLEQLELVSRKVFRGRLKGERRSRRKGQSVEFADFRNYVSGDDLRFVDWNSYARLDRLFLKLFFEEEDLHFYTLVDVSQSMDFGEPTKLRCAKQLAAALGFIGLCRGDRVRIEAIGQNPKAGSPVWRGRTNLWRLMNHVESFEPGNYDPFSVGLKNFCLKNAGKGIVVIISDLLDKEGYEEGLRYLLSREMDIYVIHILSHEELHPELQGDLKLVDCEDGDIAEISVSAPLLKRYQQTLEAFLNGAREFCMKRGLGYIPAHNKIPAEQLITNYLRQRGLVR